MPPTGRSGSPRRPPSWAWRASPRMSVLLACLRGGPRPRRNRDHRPAGARHDRRARLLVLDGCAVRGPAPAPGAGPGPVAPGARHLGHPGRERGPRLVPWTSRRCGRGLAGRQPGRAATNSCSGSSGPLPLAPWSANRRRTTALVQRTTRSLDCGWSLPGIRICRADAGGPGRHGSHGGPGDGCAGPVIGAGRAGGPDEPGADVNTGSRPRRRPAGPTWTEPTPSAKTVRRDINEAAVAAYRASIDSGKPLSERKLAAMFGKTSRRWARTAWLRPASPSCLPQWPAGRKLSYYRMAVRS